MLYPLETAVEMIPMPTAGALYQFLHRHPEIKRRYRRSSNGRGSHRFGFEQAFLTGAQILQIREMEFHSLEESRFATMAGRRGSVRSRTLGVLQHIYDRATALALLGLLAFSTSGCFASMDISCKGKGIITVSAMIYGGTISGDCGDGFSYSRNSEKFPTVTPLPAVKLQPQSLQLVTFPALDEVATPLAQPVLESPNLEDHRVTIDWLFNFQQRLP